MLLVLFTEKQSRYHHFIELIYLVSMFFFFQFFTHIYMLKGPNISVEIQVENEPL